MGTLVPFRRSHKGRISEKFISHGKHARFNEPVKKYNRTDTNPLSRLIRIISGFPAMRDTYSFLFQSNRVPMIANARCTIPRIPLVPPYIKRTVTPP